MTLQKIDLSKNLLSLSTMLSSPCLSWSTLSSLSTLLSCSCPPLLVCQRLTLQMQRHLSCPPCPPCCPALALLCWSVKDSRCRCRGTFLLSLLHLAVLLLPSFAGLSKTHVADAEAPFSFHSS